jgi:hypothetical protein
MWSFDPQRVTGSQASKTSSLRRGPLCSGKLDGTNKHFVVGSFRAGLETEAMFYSSGSC